MAKQVIDLRGEFAQAVAGDIKQAAAVLDGVISSRMGDIGRRCTRNHG